MAKAPASMEWIGHSWVGTRPGLAPRIVSAYYYDRPSWGPTGRILHDLWVLDYARTDCGLARVGSPRSPWLPRKARTAHLYPPGTPYWEDATAVRGLAGEAYVILSGGEEAGLGKLIVRPWRFARIADPAGRLDAPFHAAAEAGHKAGEAGFWRAQAAVAELIGLVMSAEREEEGTFVLPPAEAPGQGRLTSLVRATEEYFRAHMAERVTLATVARHLGMSSSALSHRYAAEAGGPPMASLAALRIEMAKGLLLRGLKMETIARQTGFCDAYHFSKAFKKACGIPPSRYRRDLLRTARRPS